MRLHRCAVALLCATLLLGACSRLDLGYRNLDWLIAWSIDDYLDLDRQQKAWLKPRLREHLDWHCSTQLPAYSAWVARSEALVAQPRLHAQQFQITFGELRQAVDSIVTEITPSSIELLRGLSTQQVAGFDQALAEENARLRRDYLQPPLEQQISQRSERMVEHLEHWFGRLSPTQQARVERWARQLGKQNRLWLENRAHWQAEFRALLDARHDADFAARLQRLLQQRSDAWTPAYREQFERSQAALAELFADLFNSTDARQRQHVLKRLGQLREDLDGLVCTTPAVPAVASRSE